MTHATERPAYQRAHVHSALIKVRELLAPRDQWTQGTFARAADGRPVQSASPDATCWCLLGATHKVCGGNTAPLTAETKAALTRTLWAMRGYPDVEDTLSPELTDFNDRPRMGRNHEEVLALIDTAIEATKGTT